eukprot:scaffold7427_cov69-Amphora_coffeaeformis.AAC.1
MHSQDPPKLDFTPPPGKGNSKDSQVDHPTAENGHRRRANDSMEKSGGAGRRARGGPGRGGEPRGR